MVEFHSEYSCRSRASLLQKATKKPSLAPVGVVPTYIDPNISTGGAGTDHGCSAPRIVCG
jgi:hypothetical protein